MTRTCWLYLLPCLLLGHELFGVDYLTEVKPILARHCYTCHGASQQKSGLRLDTAASALKGGESGLVLKAGKPSESRLIAAVRGEAPNLERMPYKKAPLTEEEISLLTRWVREGAQAPADEKPDAALHWSFIPPIRSPLPKIKDTTWARNEIDHFILARLEKENLSPSKEADRNTLIRRVTLDLIGLPPTPKEVSDFVNDAEPRAFERLVDRLLSSPHYGERWGRIWLDVARYADSNGYSIDAPRSIWKYRDWVIEALNADLPYDQFTVWQLAGDLLPNATLEQRIATGFHRNTMINEEGGIDKEQFRIEAVLDRVNTTGAAFLGLTVGCSQCHDHKFDPISQKEYYQLYAFFNNCEEPNLEIATAEELQKRDALRKEIKTVEDNLKDYLDSLAPKQQEWERSLTAEEVAKLSSEVTKVLETPPDKRSTKQKKTLADHFLKSDVEYEKRRRKLAQLERKEPKFTTTMVLEERKEPRESYVFVKGDFTRKGPTVQPGVLKVLHPFSKTDAANRLDFARWLADEGNPLFARVMINRLWQVYFGKGLVETENDFGTQGALPSHPDLFDWLATEFPRQGWSFKAMHRLIVTSATYRQSSRARDDLTRIDPYNKLLGRQSRLRMDAEVVRDVSLSVSGLLSDRIGGPSVHPPIPEGVMSLGQTRRKWEPDTGADRHRRGMYTFFFRATPYPSLLVFDAPDGNSACTRRIRSNTPLQSLTLLNDQAYFECAQALAQRLLSSGGDSDDARLEQAFQLCLARTAQKDEISELKSLLHDERKTGTEKSAWLAVARTLLNLDETITRE